MGLLALQSLLLGCGPSKKLLQWGWDEPDTADLQATVREMEETPFDGCVFSVRYGLPGSGGSFTWEFWGRRSFTRDDLSAAFSDVGRLEPGQLDESFLRVNVTPGDVYWFDDFSPITANARLAADLARAAGARGILLDVEHYQGRVFDHDPRRGPSGSDWSVHARQARRRGREITAALQDGYPGLTVFLTFGHSLPWNLSEGGRRPLSETPYGLLAPFLDGMLEAAEGRTRLVDGYELSYGFREPQQFEASRETIRRGVLPIVGAPDAYRQRLQLAFGLWLDYDWRRQGWSPSDHDDNYFSPARFENAVKAALDFSDEYVWVYAETPRWWGHPAAESAVPPAYSSALLRARKAVR